MKTKTIEIPENLDLNLEKLIELGVLTQKQPEKKVLTYDDIQDMLYKENSDNYSKYYIGDDNLYFIHKNLEPNLEALVKFINTAKYLNGDWLPDFNDKTQSKYMHYYDHDKNIFKIISNPYLQCNAVLFKTKQLAEQAIQISGVNINEVLSEFKLEDILNHIDHDKILEIIGKDKCKEYFDLVNYPDVDERDY